ncbi:hypothetical protein BpHYR1_042741 [Brachionus plicatilis]|uniref:Uncharacterized protein n=1 Tax=Brachionus plicatilis TaxID=10195 RepID=A0A3M7SB26_BRAPC|nr:hypothetical protein BpHYR1_042741 [Brachionus plicatilis]
MDDKKLFFMEKSGVGRNIDRLVLDKTAPVDNLAKSLFMILCSKRNNSITFVNPVFTSLLGKTARDCNFRKVDLKDSFEFHSLIFSLILLNHA